MASLNDPYWANVRRRLEPDDETNARRSLRYAALFGEPADTELVLATQEEFRSLRSAVAVERRRVTKINHLIEKVSERINDVLSEEDGLLGWDEIG